MARTVKISEARARLFRLVDDVIDTDGIVSIEHRDREERVLLVSEKRFRYLEETLNELKKRTETLFHLAGSIDLLVSEEELEEALKEARAEQARLAKLKFRGD